MLTYLEEKCFHGDLRARSDMHAPGDLTIGPSAKDTDFIVVRELGRTELDVLGGVL